METIESIIENQEQIYGDACIESVIEVVLKLEGRVGLNYYGLQTDRNSGNDSDFTTFHNKELFGLKFKREFAFSRGHDYPFDLLFERIDELLANGQFVVISLEILGGTHNFIIYSINENNDYDAITKLNETNIINDVKVKVNEMQGTEILTYELIEN